jgi:hypothetical protein
VISAPATEHGNTSDEDAKAQGLENSQPDDDPTLNNILIEMERLALLKLEV